MTEVNDSQPTAASAAPSVPKPRKWQPDAFVQRQLAVTACVLVISFIAGGLCYKIVRATNTLDQTDGMIFAVWAGISTLAMVGALALLGRAECLRSRMWWYLLHVSVYFLGFAGGFFEARTW